VSSTIRNGWSGRETTTALRSPHGGSRETAGARLRRAEPATLARPASQLVAPLLRHPLTVTPRGPSGFLQAAVDRRRPVLDLLEPVVRLPSRSESASVAPTSATVRWVCPERRLPVWTRDSTVKPSSSSVEPGSTKSPRPATRPQHRPLHPARPLRLRAEALPLRRKRPRQPHRPERHAKARARIPPRPAGLAWWPCYRRQGESWTDSHRSHDPVAWTNAVRKAARSRVAMVRCSP